VSGAVTATKSQLDNWEDHWSDYAESASTNPAQEYRRRLIIEALQSGAGETGQLIAGLLDIGSGQGDLLRDLRVALPEAGRLLGLELSASGIKIAQLKVPEANFVKTDLLADSTPQEPYARFASHAVCSEVLEHVDDPSTLLRNASRYLRGGALIVVTVPGGPRSTFDRHIGHRRHFSKRRLENVLLDAGFESIEVRAAGFPVFNIYKLVVIAAGKRLITAAAAPTSGASGLASRIFEKLFQIPMPRSMFGWQLVATAKFQGTTN
jgi:2-polyprenyl-3-methyl-5-hydroxy-6-metoxy-1,4-benzoquinol methylase